MGSSSSQVENKENLSFESCSMEVKNKVMMNEGFQPTPASGQHDFEQAEQFEEKEKEVLLEVQKDSNRTNQRSVSPSHQHHQPHHHHLQQQHGTTKLDRPSGNKNHGLNGSNGGGGSSTASGSAIGGGFNASSMGWVKSVCLKRFRYIVKNLGYEYAPLVLPPCESINFVALPSRGKLREIDHLVQAFAFYMHIQDKWVDASAAALSTHILNSLYTVLVNFHAHCTDLSFHQLKRLFDKVKRRVEFLMAEIQVLMKHQRYICPCGTRFDESSQFWAHRRADTSRVCNDNKTHVCNCGLVFEDHTVWRQHALAQDWPLCGMSLLAHMFSMQHTGATSGVVEDLDYCFKCVGCSHVVDNYFLHYIHVAYCEPFLEHLQQCCPFCNPTVAATTAAAAAVYGQMLPDQMLTNGCWIPPPVESNCIVASTLLGDNVEMSRHPTIAGLAEVAMTKEEIAVESENWTLILCKICLLFGITLEDVSNE